jgi:nucleoside-diphosphate-sugar epimerase
MFWQLYGTPVAILRPFMVYGPGQAREKLIPHVATCLARGQAPCLSSGRVRGDWIYIDDVIDAFIIATSAGGVEGQTFDLGCGALISAREVVEKLAAVMGSPVTPQFGVLPDRPFEREIAANPASAAQKLGWHAATSLEEGLRRTARWYASEQAALD